MTPPRINLPSGLCVCLDRGCAIPCGYCHCGCGEKTKIAKCTDGRSFIGHPKQWLIGHANRKNVAIVDALPFKIGDEYCRLIPLTQGHYAIVSAVDYLWLMQWKWYAVRCKTTGAFYAVRTEWKNGKQSSIMMHCQILGLKARKDGIGDHKDHLRTTENRRGNLRVAGTTESMGNIGIPSHNTSGLKGASYVAQRGKWLAQIQYQNVNYFLGYYDTKEEAHAVYFEAAKRLFGEFACAG